MNAVDPGQRRAALVRARCTLAIVHAQYWRALMLAEGADERERAAALAEARRLLTVAVALRRRAEALEAAERAGGQRAEGHERDRSRPSSNASARLTAA